MEREGIKIHSCDNTGLENIEVSHGTLKLIVKNENMLDKEFTGATISSKACFKNSRIEIRAKVGTGRYLYSNLLLITNQYNCHGGEQKGQVDIATIIGFYSVLLGFAKLHCGDDDGQFAYKYLRGLDYKQFQTYGIELSETTLQIFVNDHVYFQSNPYNDQEGSNYNDVNNPLYLPFQHPFKLLLNTGLYDPRSLLSTKLDQIDPNWKLDWKKEETQAFEIDYIRVYGEQPQFVIGDKTTASTLNDSSINFTIIIIIGVIFILSLVLLVVLIIFLRRKNTKLNQEIIDKAYDDIGQDQNHYEHINYDYETVQTEDYETVIYKELDKSVEYLEVLPEEEQTSI